LLVVGRAARSRDSDAAVAAFERAHALAVRHDMPLAQLSALHELGTIDMFSTGRRDRLLDARRGAEAAGAVRLTAVLDLQLVAAHHMHGDRQPALEASRRAVEEITALGIEPMRVIALALAACPAALTADRDLVEEASPPARSTATRTHCRASGAPRGPPARSCARTDRPPCARWRRPRPWWPGRRRSAHRPGGGSGCCSARWRAATSRRRSRGCAPARRSPTGTTSRVPSSPRRSWPAAADARPRPLPRSRPGTPSGCRGRGCGSSAAGWSPRPPSPTAGEPRAWLAEAAAYFDGFGAPAVAAACRRLVAGRPALPDDLRRLGVTPREAEILGLLGPGLTGTRELAEHLVISPRTVEKHIEALCRKLGVRSRGGLTALAARHPDVRPGQGRPGHDRAAQDQATT
jgi:DNA-binding CsgD family transcriptional regulator